MRVLLLNQTFYPDVAATAQHAHDLGKHLVEQGHQVIVVASRSIYGQKGAVLPKRETVDGIEVHRVGMSLFGKGSILARLFDFGLFYLLATIKVLTVKRPDVVVPFTTPPFIVLVAWLMKAIRGSRYVYWVMDLYPDLPIQSGMFRRGGLLARALESIHRFCLRHADRVVVLGRCMRDRVIAKGIPPGKLARICVWSDTQEIEPIPFGDGEYRDLWNLRGKFVVMYSGNLGLAHDVQTMCAAAERLKPRDDIRFVFVGGGKRMDEVRRFAHERNLPNVILHPYQPREKLTRLLGLADVHLITVAEGMEGMIVPSKLYGVMASARPSIYVGNETSEVACVLREEQCGVLVPVGAAGDLVRAIETLSQDRSAGQAMGRRARTALHEKYTRRIACGQWEHVLLDVAGGKRDAATAGALPTRA